MLIKKFKYIALGFFVLFLMCVVLFKTPLKISAFESQFESFAGNYYYGHYEYYDGEDYIVFVWENEEDIFNVQSEEYYFSIDDFNDDVINKYNLHDPNSNSDEVIIYWNFEIHQWQLTEYHTNYVPVYDGQTAFVTNVDNPMTLDDILSHIKLIDEEDGDVSHRIIVDTDNYTVNQNKVGTYSITLIGSDLTGNEATLTIQVLVKDVVKPVITGPASYNQNYTTKKDISIILAALSCTDNYDTVNPTIKVESDNYSANFGTIGSYNIVVYATDISGNKTTFTITINVVDGVAPTFTGPTTILKGQSETLSLNDIKSQVIANDAIDGVLNVIVESDNYSGKADRVGTYTIVFKATDVSGNSSTHTVTITVSDDIPPVFYVDNYFITVEQSLILTQQDIIDLLVASGQLQIQATTKIMFIQNEYLGNEQIPGTYAVTLTSSSVDGSSNQISVAVLVEEDPDAITVEPDDNWFEKSWSDILSFFKWFGTPTKDNGHFYKGYFVLISLVVVVGGFLVYKKKN